MAELQAADEAKGKAEAAEAARKAAESGSGTKKLVESGSGSGSKPLDAETQHLLELAPRMTEVVIDMWNASMVVRDGVLSRNPSKKSTK